jgi:hypothetical protein
VVLGHPPYPAFVDELRRRGAQVSVGETVVETDASSADAALDVLRTLELPLILAFNRGRLMVLPQAVAKSTGLRQALGALRLSIHNTIGIGDAENDHDLLDACEVGVAVAWGSRTLRGVADEVIDGAGPAAVGDYIRRVSQQPRLSAAQMGRRRLLLGHRHNGDPISLAIRGRTVVIAGEPGTGQIVAGRFALRAAHPAGLLPLHHRSRGRLPIARSAAERDHAGRRRPAAERARDRQGAAPSRM